MANNGLTVTAVFTSSSLLKLFLLNYVRREDYCSAELLSSQTCITWIKLKKVAKGNYTNIYRQNVPYSIKHSRLWSWNKIKWCLTCFIPRLLSEKSPAPPAGSFVVSVKPSSVLFNNKLNKIVSTGKERNNGNTLMDICSSSSFSWWLQIIFRWLSDPQLNIQQSQTKDVLK